VIPQRDGLKVRTEDLLSRCVKDEDVAGDFSMDDEPVIILSTAGEVEAKGIAQALVMQHLAACVNITGVASVYRWKGDLCEDREQLLIIKTVNGQVDSVMREIRNLHSYELPEMIVLPVAGGYPPYLQWLAEETRS
jgi:periplasmic divalent cation tolerance protein